MAMMQSVRRRIGAFIGGFEAGRRNRRLKSFHASRAHINSLIGAAGPTINARARWLVRNNGYALNALEAWTGEAVGDGIKPTPQMPDDTAKAAIKTLWDKWAFEADADGLTDFYGLQRRAAREMFLTGEVFFRFRPRLPQDGLSVPLQLEMIPSEMLPLWHNKELPGGGMIRQGIEFDLLGRRAAYYFLRRHPGDSTDPRLAGEIVRVPAREVIHLMDPVEAGQVRGISRFTPAVVKLFFLDQYDDAELDRKKVASMFAMFVTSPAPDAPLESTDQPLAVEPGQIVRLDQGEGVVTADAADSGSTYEPFQYRTILQISAALGVPYSYISNDLAKANFANSRLSIIAFRRRLTAWQHRVMVHQMCKRVWGRWMDMAVMAGALTLRGYTKQAGDWQRCGWLPPPWAWVDPLKDINAMPAKVQEFRFKKLIRSYQKSERFQCLAPRTKQDYIKVLNFLEEKIGHLEPAQMQRRHVIALQDANKKKQRFANYCVQLLSVLFEHAIDQGVRKDNPAKGGRLRNLTNGEKHTAVCI